MEVVDDTDAIIIAGGDGALSEAVTGLLRRPDQERIAKLAIGIAPIGKTNTIARRLFGSQLTNVQFIGEAMMAAIRDQRRAFDVIHIEGNQGKPVYALAELQWGPLREAKERASKYWYLGPLKRRATYVISVMKEWPQYVRAKLSYVLPCEGCSKCYVAPPPPPPLRWWQSILRTESNKERS
ncbi:PREDICTED: acylglycerol kinase, mitochondrial-like [Priapulus caudatus]|uniref:Acylglycerol kinase, mitochondrial n=1 Tax=Priapulus caudatus TaxID=37621 RepID=A0ABM1DQ04_PRICU|nr:PREDICTED: acylglycerol kinase, mitochondrial-like [Priapulus caudatus]